MQKSDFSEIIGYDRVKEELCIIGDMFSNPAKYEKIGATVPKGILLEGEPGIGKTTFAETFMAASGVNTYVIRRNKDTVAFLEEINKVFMEAKENAPSIILLDDMDKFVKDKDSFEEFTTVQACIDSVQKSTVLVIATVNNLGIIPPSLVRSGRFDRIIQMLIGEADSQAGNYWKYLIKNENITIDVEDEDISKLFYAYSPSMVKSILNDALILVAFKNEDSISKEDLLKAYLKCEQLLYESSDKYDEKELLEIAFHEAGHAVMMETLNPGSIGIVTVEGSSFESTGFVRQGVEIKNPEHLLQITLAGKYAEEKYSNRASKGATQDLNRYDAELNRMMLYDGYYGIKYIENDLNTASEMFKEELLLEKRKVTERLSKEVKDIIEDNWNTVERIAKELAVKKALLASDIKRLMEAA